MADRPVAFFDSGVGGLPYYAWAAERLPSEHFVYLADTANFPYGEKPVEDLERIVLDAVGGLIAAADPKVVVVACNTASVVALEALRKRYAVPFVGVVPAIKPAARASRNRSIGLFATARTVGDRYTDSLIRDFAADCSIARVADGALVRFVESRILDADAGQRRAAVAVSAAALRAARVDAVVLGCTHFVYLAAEVEEALGRGVKVLDSREGVGRQLARIIGPGKVNRATRDPRERLRDRLMVTGFPQDSTRGSLTPASTSEEARYRAFAAHFGMEYAGVIGIAAEPTRSIAGAHALLADSGVTSEVPVSDHE